MIRRDEERRAEVNCCKVIGWLDFHFQQQPEPLQPPVILEPRILDAERLAIDLLPCRRILTGRS